MAGTDDDDGDLNLPEDAEAAVAEYEPLEPSHALAVVDGYIREARLSQGDFGLVSQNVWPGFLEAADLTPIDVGSGDVEVVYKGVRLRESAAG